MRRATREMSGRQGINEVVHKNKKTKLERGRKLHQTKAVTHIVTYPHTLIFNSYTLLSER